MGDSWHFSIAADSLIILVAAVNYGAGNNSRSILMADLNGDSYSVLVMWLMYSGNHSILETSGDDAFKVAINYQAGSIPSSVFTADLDGDDNDNGFATANIEFNNLLIPLNQTSSY